MNKSTTAVGIVLVAVLVACTGGSDAQDARGDSPAAAASRTSDETSDLANPECASELDAAFASWAEAGFSGSIAISSGDRFDCLAAYGYADRDGGTPNGTDTVFSIGSISKAFTAAAIFGLVDDGSLALDDRAGDVLPELNGPAAEATIEQLLLHTSGLTGSHGSDHRPLDRDEAVAAIGKLEQSFEPGTDYLYSNAGYTLLALIVDELSDAGYRDHLASRILPLPGDGSAGGFWDGEPAAPGPRAVGYLSDGPSSEMGEFEGPHWALDGNGGLAMTAEDLAAWTNALFDGDVVSSKSVQVIAAPGFDHDDGTAETPGWVAYDESTIGEPFLMTAGGGGDIGHEAVVAWFPGSERTIVVMSNTADVTAGQLVRAVGPELAANEPLPRPATSDGDAGKEGLAELSGTYTLDSGGSITVAAGDDGLEAAASGVDAVAALFPPSGGITTEDVAAHEDAVMALLAGETAEGREEVAILESDIGPTDDVELAGTVAVGELRTYVVVTSGSESIMLWYALNEHGGTEAVEGPVELPVMPLVPHPDGGFRPDDPTGDGPDISVDFTDDGVVITGPGGRVAAERST